MLRSLTLLFATRRGLALFARSALAVLGALAGLLQVILAIWSGVTISDQDRWNIFLALFGASVIAAIANSWPRSSITREFNNPEITVRVVVGDLFEQNSHLVVGFSDTFDTDTTNSVVVSKASVQGQFLERVYGGNIDLLDSDISDALSGVPIVSAEDVSEKNQGKVERYPLGTVAVLGSADRHYFCVAYSKMQNNLIASSSVDYLWKALGATWEAVYLRGQRSRVSIPLVGSELARIACLNRESLLKMVMLSFVARSRESVFSKELTIVIHPTDYHHINMLEVASFLRSL